MGLLYTAEIPADPKTEGRGKSIKGTKNKRMYSANLEEVGKFQYQGSAVKEWQEFNGNLYILDEQTQEIQKFTRSGELLGSSGKRGDAPWENKQTQHMWIDEEGIATVDNAQMTVKKYNHEGRLLFYGKMDEPIWDGIYLGDQRFLLLNDISAAPAFYKVDIQGDSSGPLQPISEMLNEIPEGEYLNIMFEGQMLRSNSSVTYMCSRTGMFMVFDKGGTYRFTGYTIDRTSPPRVTARTTGNMTYFVREPDNSINYSGTMDEDYLYILSLISWGATSTLSIDVYNLSTGEYAYSLSVPNAGNDLPIEILKGEHLLYILYEGQLVISYAVNR